MERLESAATAISKRLLSRATPTRTLGSWTVPPPPPPAPQRLANAYLAEPAMVTQVSWVVVLWVMVMSFWSTSNPGARPRTKSATRLRICA